METMSWTEWLKQLQTTPRERGTKMNTMGMINDALADYEQGRLHHARNTLLQLTRRIVVTDENIHEIVMENITNPSAAAEGWIDVAIDMIDRELGEDNHAHVPVRCALLTAIELLK